jgi:DNA invertase Pin-like site-specific DNA recombinase
MAATVGYLRVADGESDGPQRAALAAAGCTTVFRDVAHGATAPRPQWESCVRSLRAGDRLVVCGVDRLGRNLNELVELIEELRDRDVRFVSLAEPELDISGERGAQVVSSLLLAATYQTALIRERTSRGLNAVAVRGRLGGRKRKMTPELQERAQRMYDTGSHSVREIAEICGVSRETVYRNIRTRTDGG